MRNGWPDPRSNEIRTRPTTESEYFSRGTYTIRPEIELAALKSVLLTFDHLLAGNSKRFPRSADLTDVREFVKATILTRFIEPENFHRFSLGLQYERLTTIRAIRDGIDPPPVEFEHIMIASANAATRTLDAVWLLAGMDPHGFRLSDKWQGGDFTCIIINQMLVGGRVLGPFWRNLPVDICTPTDRRTYPKHAESIDGEKMLAEIAEHRRDGYRCAVRLVERECDLLLIDRLAESAMLDSDHANLIIEVVRARLKRLYFLRLKDPATLRSFEEIVEARLAEIPVDIREQRVICDLDKDSVDWDQWMGAYRDVLRQLEPQLGLPGEKFVIESKVHIDRAQSRKVGETPAGMP